MRQCRPPLIAGRSRPKRALTANAPCPTGTLGGALVVAPGLAPGGRDCSIGPLGAAGAGLAGVMVWAGPGGTDGTSLGGRTGVPVKNCAWPGAGIAATHATTANWAKTSWPPLPVLVPPSLMARI